MIKLENISKIFNKGQATEALALQDVSLQINTGDFVVVTGSNGSGKSTLLNCIAGSILADSGTIYIDETAVHQLPDYKRSKFISRIFQNPLQGTAPDLSIKDNFRLAALRTKPKMLYTSSDGSFEETIKEKISLLKMGLENNIDKQMGSLSGGQRQALTLIMGIMDDCKIMLLDEPTAALDPRSSLLVIQKAEEIIYTHKLTALLVTHHLKDALRYGNRILSMHEGRIVKDISGEEKKNLGLEELVKWYD